MTRHFEPFCLLLRTPPPYFSGLQGHQNTRTVDIDGRPSLSSFQSVVAREEIAAIDPDFVETEASVPDGMR